MEPCAKCSTAISKVKPIITRYSCKIVADENEVSRPYSEINEKEYDIIGEKKEEQRQTIPKKKDPCEGIQIPRRRKTEFLKANNCQLPFSRAWNKNEKEISSKNELLPKWVGRQQRTHEPLECLRELDEYGRNLWIPICKPPIKPLEEVILEPIDQTVCVFCLGSLYTGGYLHDVYEKMPYIKKQSEEYNDAIILRIGIRSRITVHKKCYNEYIDRPKPEDEGETEEKDESDSDMWCGENREESEDEIVDLVTVKQENFCLRKPKLPKLPSGGREGYGSHHEKKDGLAIKDLNAWSLISLLTNFMKILCARKTH